MDAFKNKRVTSKKSQKYSFVILLRLKGCEPSKHIESDYSLTQVDFIPPKWLLGKYMIQSNNL